MSAVKSLAIVAITVTALDAKLEPRDHKIPLFKQLDALPDYELKLILKRGGTIRLGAKPNSSAAEGLTWHLSEPVSTSRIASIRLQEQDKLISDAIAEVEIVGDVVTENGFRFDFATEHSFGTGVDAFFDLPIGKAIAAGFTIAVLILILCVFLG